MSFLQQSGSQVPFSEIIPDNLRAGGLTKSSSIVQRRTVRITPQTGPSYGSTSAGTGAGNSQVQFLIADQGGFLDPRSCRLNYTIMASGAEAAPDDGHPFNVVQVQLNGQMVDNVSGNAAKVTNIEFNMGASQSYYRTAGSLQGFELLSPDGNPGVAAADAHYGSVENNQASVSIRALRAGVLMNNNLGGVSRSIPLGLLSGVFRCPTALPLSLLGEINLLLVSGAPNEVLSTGFVASPTATVDYSLANVSLEYDILVPSEDLMTLYKKVAMDPNDAGLNYVVETTIITGGQTIGTAGTSATALQETNLVVSRASSYLTRAAIVQVVTAGLSSNGFYSQSCFSNGNTYSVQWRVGSSVFPNIAPQGPAALFNMSLAAYGGPTNENGSCVTRCLWGNSTNFGTPATAAVFAGSECTAATGSLNASTKYAGGDRFIPAYSFEQVRGGYTKPDLQGVSLSGASGSQIIGTIVSAPPTQYSLFMMLVALKVIRCQGGSVRVEGA